MPFLIILAVVSIAMNVYLIGRVLRNGTDYGDIVVTRTEDGLTYMLELDGDPGEIVKYNRICFRVKDAA